MAEPDHETIFAMQAIPVKFGRGASAEAGWEGLPAVAPKRVTEQELRHVITASMRNW